MTRLNRLGTLRRGSGQQIPNPLCSIAWDHEHRVLEDALNLSAEERADLAAELIASLDGEPDPDVEAAWAEEIEHRARRALAGASPGRDWEDVRDDIEKKLTVK